jgi:hypothetical protein
MLWRANGNVLNMKTIKRKICILMCLGLSNCAVVDSSNFEYLDEDNLELQSVLIVGADQNVEISIPKSLSIDIPKTLLVESERLELPYTKALDFPYEWLWGGPAHKDKGLYLFELAFLRENSGRALSESVEDRIRNVRMRYENFDEGKWRDYVLAELVVQEYESKQGYWWVMENKPTIMKHHEQYVLPISDEHQLVIWFWYNEDWVKDHPDWFERRKALSRRIIDTVKLTKPN